MVQLSLNLNFFSRSLKLFQVPKKLYYPRLNVQYTYRRLFLIIIKCYFLILDGSEILILAQSQEVKGLLSGEGGKIGTAGIQIFGLYSNSEAF
jgi:hypothetical protein